jgi:hypothetical protein
LLDGFSTEFPEIRAEEKFQRIGPLTSSFPHSNLDLDYQWAKTPNKVYKHCTTGHCAYAYHDVSLRYALYVCGLLLESRRRYI